MVIEAVGKGELLCEAVHAPSGETLVTEAPVDNGGQGRYFSPTDLVTAVFGTCALTIMGLFAQYEGPALAGTNVRVVTKRGGGLNAYGQIHYFPAHLAGNGSDSRKPATGSREAGGQTPLMKLSTSLR